MDKDNLAILLQNKGAVVGAVWAELSIIGYAILYPQFGGYYTSLFYKLLFLFVLILDKVESAINPNFSFTYALVYTYRANAIVFIFIVGIGGVAGGFIGAGVEYITEKAVGYVSEHQEPGIKKAKGIILKVQEKVGNIIKKTLRAYSEGIIKEMVYSALYVFPI